MDDPSKEKIFWFALFFAVLVVRALFNGSRILENLTVWWEKRQNPVVKTLPEDDMKKKMDAAREKMARLHEEELQKNAASRENEAKKESEKRLKKMENLEKKIRGEDVDDDDAPNALGPSADNPRRAPYKLAGQNSCGSSRYRPSGFPRRGGGGG